MLLVQSPKSAPAIKLAAKSVQALLDTLLLPVNLELSFVVVNLLLDTLLNPSLLAVPLFTRTDRFPLLLSSRNRFLSISLNNKDNLSKSKKELLKLKSLSTSKRLSKLLQTKLKKFTN